MRRLTFVSLAVVLCLTAGLAIGFTAARPASPAAELTSGKVNIQSAGALAFGPAGILFVGDSVGGNVAAIDTGDSKAMKAGSINVQGLDAKVAALVGIPADQVVINYMAVNPISHNVYVSGARGKGPDATPLLVKVDASGNVTNVSLDNAKNSVVALVDAPASNPAQRGGNPRMLTITDMAYLNGNVMVAGLSNEEWNSSLRSIPYPFTTAAQGTTLQIWHASHGRYETAAPIRTFVPYTISGTQYILAAYTCTPLVKIPVSDLKPGAQVKGTTISDLGSGNQPLDMIPYKKDGHDFILVANSKLGVMKLKADNLENYEKIDSPTVPNPPTNIFGVPYDTLQDLKGVQHIARLDDNNAIMLVGQFTGASYAPGAPAGPVNLQTVALP
jgi:hypothetical protein